MTEIDNYILEIDMLRANYMLEKENKNFDSLFEKVDNDLENYILEIDTLRYDILDYWLMLSDDERENEWNNYSDEEKEELNEKREELLFLLYWDN
jgi:hypothetical protein